MNLPHDPDSDTLNMVTVERLGAVRRLTLNRTEVRNALSFELLVRLREELESATDDQETSVVILRGAGRGFSAGFDLSGGSTARDLWSDRERQRRFGREFEAIWYCPLPVIACVHGFCLAGAADLALHCDFMVATPDVRIGYPPVRDMGVPPTNMWLYRAGLHLAKRLLLTGDSINGLEAYQCGIATLLSPSSDIDSDCLAFADRIAQVGRETLMGNKAVLNRGIDLMGRANLNRFAEFEDALAHRSPAADRFRVVAQEAGLREAVRLRDAPFQPDPSGFISSGYKPLDEDRSKPAPK
jgi:enoyl-CoA hydratase